MMRSCCSSWREQKTLEFSEHTSLEAHNPCIIATQLLHPFSYRFSDLLPDLWSSVVTAELKDYALNLLRSYDPKIQDIDLVLLQSGAVHCVKHQQRGQAPLYARCNYSAMPQWSSAD
jgi:hypothetical protein